MRPVIPFCLCWLAWGLAGGAGAEPITSGPDAVPLGVELLPNGGLEAPCPAEPPADGSPWPPGFQFFPRRDGGTVRLDREVSLDGGTAMRFEPQLLGDNGFSVSCRTDLPVRPGDQFHASLYVRVEGGFESYRSLGLAFLVEGYEGTKTELIAVRPPRVLPGSGDWRKVALTATAPPNARRLVSVSFKISNTPYFGRCWWDALSLTKVKAAAPEEQARPETDVAWPLAE